ncbi:GNAT family N-acetyltransferase [Falsiroseomonas oryziterrae]|uniref:GNAT family N-acetyltransferase n=1 Tax=Falsiroseomonas oryziterrae TaxID=2911368 RepID=UPI001F409FBB|nr:GNAT family N-acetyltransferase [Roseomonas sp. NPKOSM-4]
MADLPALVGLLADDALGREREAPGLPLTQAYLDAFAAIERDPNQLLAVAEHDGRLVGMLQLSFIPGLSHRGAWRGQIESVRVAAGQRGAGLGQRMIEWAVEQCRARGCSIVQLTTDKSRADAHRFYARLGFRATHEGFKLRL